MGLGCVDGDSRYLVGGTRYGAPCGVGEYGFLQSVYPDGVMTCGVFITPAPAGRPDRCIRTLPNIVSPLRKMKRGVDRVAQILLPQKVFSA